MFCINCFHKNTRVINSRPHKKQPQVWRRRTCPKCNITFSTRERPSLQDNTPVYRGSKPEPFNLGKLIISVYKSFTHNQNEASQYALWLAHSTEDILSTQSKLITPEIIEATAHKVLKDFDELAALQYAAQHKLITSTRRRGRPSLHAPERPIDESPSQ